MTTADQPRPDDTVRILIPDHDNLGGQVRQAAEFAGSLRHANDDDGSEPWQLPDQLTAPALEQAIDDAVLHQPWFWHVGDLREHARTEISIAHAGIGHMGVYVTSMPRVQLQALLDAAALLRQAEDAPFAERTPVLAEIGAFVSAWRHADKHEDLEASLAGWLVTVAVLGLAVAGQPTTEHRPHRLLDAVGRFRPVGSTDGTSPAADTALLLERIDAAGDSREVELDAEAFEAFRRLVTEWHAAIYGARANDPSSLLGSMDY